MVHNYRSAVRRSLYALTSFVVVLASVGFTTTRLPYEYRRCSADVANGHIYRVMTTYTSADGVQRTYPLGSGRIAQAIRMNLGTAQAVTQVAASHRWPNVLDFQSDPSHTDTFRYSNGIYTDENFFETFQLPIVQGTSQISGNGIIISRRMATELFGTEAPISKTLYADQWITLTVVGTFENISESSSLQFDFVAPFTVFRKLRGIPHDSEVPADYLETYVRTFVDEDATMLTRQLNHSEIAPRNIVEGGEGFTVQCMPNICQRTAHESGIWFGNDRGKYLLILIGAAMAMLSTLRVSRHK